MRYYSSTAVESTLTSDITDTANSMPAPASTSGWPTSVPFTAVLDRDLPEEEIVEVTAIGASWSITRGVDGSTAVAHSTGATVTHMATARDFREPQQHLDATSAVHGVTGALVGTTDTQTLKNKTLEAASSGVSPLTTKAVASQTAPLIVNRDPSSAILSGFEALGSVFTGPTTRNYIHTPSAAILYGGIFVGQEGGSGSVDTFLSDRNITTTGKHFHAKNGSGTSLFSVDNSGNVAVNGTVDGVDVAALGATVAGHTTSINNHETRLDDAESAWTAYSPSWTGTTTNPTIGNGTLTGRYKQVGKTVHMTISLTIGSTTSAGSGVYGFSLPVAARDLQQVVGSAYGSPGIGVFRNSGGVMVVTLSSGSSVASSTGLSNGDTLRISATYEAA